LIPKKIRNIKIREGEAAMGNIKIGWAQRDITPTVPVALVGWAVDRFAEEVRDPLTVTGLALESTPGDYVIMVSCDILWIKKMLQVKVRQRVLEQIPELDGNMLFLFATHTHNAPYQSTEDLQTIWGATRNYQKDKQTDYLHPDDYHEMLIERISEVAISAWKSRKAGGISYGHDRVAIGQNRRVVYDDSTVQMYGETKNKNFLTFEGPEDNNIELIYLWDSNQQLTGVAVNIACPSQTLESRSYVSADYWNEVRVELRRKFGDSIHVLPMLAPSGDVAPHEIIRHPNGHVGAIGDEIGLHFRIRDFDAELRRTARHIVFVIEEVLPQAKLSIRTDVKIKHIVKDVQLPRRRVTKADAEEAKKKYMEWWYRNDRDPMDYYDELSRQERFALANLIITIKHFEKQQHESPFSMELHVVRIGDIVITTNPFELYTDYGLHIRANSEAMQTFNIQLACDQAGYLPTEKAAAGGSYGALIFNGEIGPDGGRLLVDHTVALIHQLWKDIEE
jgi:hypothetical protein